MPSKTRYKLSIVVAMYNIEDYIRYCLESCVNQKDVNNGDYEIIIVNDGSTDRSPAIAEEFRADNVRIISQANAGLSAARNAGMKAAGGEYIWFVDGDDAIAPDAVSTILSSIRNDAADAYICNFSTFMADGIIETSHFKIFSNLSGAEIHEKYLKILPMMAWLTIYRLDCLKEKGLEFLPGIYHEDFEFSIRAHHCMASISFIGESLYRYRVARKDSIMDTVKRDNTKSLLSDIAIIDSFSGFFAGEDTRFTKKLYGVCATSFFTKWYGSASAPGETAARLFKENKARLGRMLWKSGRWKMQFLYILNSILPGSLLKRVYCFVGRQSRLM